MKDTDNRLWKILPYVLEIAAAVAIIAGVWFGTNKADAAENNLRSSGEVVEIASTNASGSQGDNAETGDGTLQAGNNHDIDTLVNQYYYAKQNQDADSLNKIVDSDTKISAEELAGEAEYIEKYGDILTYTIPYLTDNYFLVYVKYNIYFKGLDTGAAALNRYVITKDSDGYFYFYDHSITGELRTFITETDSSEAIVKLKNQVNEELQEECSKDEALNSLIELLNKGVVDASKETNSAIDQTSSAASTEEDISEDDSKEENTTGEEITEQDSAIVSTNVGQN